MLVHQLATDRSNIRIVDGEHLDCDSADRRPAPQFDATPLEMILPNISARVEQAGQRARRRVDAADIGSLVAIAVHTGQGQVVSVSFASMLTRNDVVHLQRQRIAGRGQVAVFTAVAGARPDVANQIRAHEWVSGFSPRTTRALDCMMASTLATCK